MDRITRFIRVKSSPSAMDYALLTALLALLMLKGGTLDQQYP